MSDKAQPAPGPWVAAETIPAHDGYPAVWQIDAEHHAVCTTQFCYAENTAANARLIAAAPDMLAALTALLDDHVQLVNCGDCGNWDPEAEPEVIAARAAIAKATGA